MNNLPLACQLEKDWFMTHLHYVISRGRGVARLSRDSNECLIDDSIIHSILSHEFSLSSPPIWDASSC